MAGNMVGAYNFIAMLARGGKHWQERKSLVHSAYGNKTTYVIQRNKFPHQSGERRKIIKMTKKGCHHHGNSSAV
jgi:hypothetical protein